MLILVKFHQGYNKEKNVSNMICIKSVDRINSTYKLCLMSVCMLSLEQLLQIGLDRNALKWGENKKLPMFNNRNDFNYSHCSAKGY